jgi:hypothetical protein
MAREYWLTSPDQSPRVPARYPKATTIKRKDAWKERTISQREGYQDGSSGISSHDRHSARLLRPWKAIATVHCIYCTGAVRNARMNACQTGSKIMPSRRISREQHVKKEPETFGTRNEGSSIHIPPNTNKPIHRNLRNPILKSQPPATPSQSTPTTLSPISHPHPPSSSHL